jgi:shikimate kinase
MIVNLNGWPGVGKLTVARELSKLIDGVVVDNHTILNVGSAIAREGSPEFYAVVRAVRAVAFDAILRLPPGVPVILTNVVARGGTSGFLEENWLSVVDLAKFRDCELFSVILTCSAIENARRIASADRGLLGKIQDVELLSELRQTRTLFDEGARFRLTIDNSDTSPEEAAERIESWIRGIKRSVEGTA